MMIKDYYHDKKLRTAMSQLALNTFGINFELLYQKGYWAKGFSCYSFFEDDKIVSNVSYHKLEIEKDDKRYTAMSIDSVMTDPSYRKKGYARQLLEEVLIDHPADVIFLSANETVTEFYPRFGFEPIKHIKYKDLNIERYTLGDKGRKLNIDQDIKLIDEYVRKRLKNSKEMYVYHDDYIKMFYMLYLYSDYIYLHKDAIVICQKKNNILYVHDIYMISEQSIYDLIGPYTKDVDHIQYSFEVKVDNLTPYEDNNSYFFVKTNLMALKQPWSYPGTSVT